MKRVYNFSPGPSMLPLPVLEQAQKELVSYGDTGVSVMEMSHRSGMYLEIFEEVKASLADVMQVPENYQILLLQGGAMTQFSGVPLNLMTRSGSADYIDSGNFASLAAKEAERYGKVRVVASSKEDNYTYVPETKLSDFSTEADYVHITTNNTVYGTRFVTLPDTGEIPLVADMSSNILSEVYDVSKFGVIYAGAQKNIGPAGLCVLLIRKDLLGHAHPLCPRVMNWEVQTKGDSMVNTPNTYGIYMAGLSFKWVKAQGGVAAMEKHNIEKAQILYDYLDESKLFTPLADQKYRSRMNVVFKTPDPDTDAAFVKAASGQGLINLKGYRTVGGMRASIYNAMPMEGVKALVRAMQDFEVAQK